MAERMPQLDNEKFSSMLEHRKDIMADDGSFASNMRSAKTMSSPYMRQQSYPLAGRHLLHVYC